MPKTLHCVTAILEHGEDSYERVSFLPSAREAAIASRGAALLGMPAYRRKVKEGSLLFQAKISDGDRTERDGLTKEDLLAFAETMKIPSIAKWVEQHAEIIDKGEVPPALQDAPPGFNYCTVEGYKAARSEVAPPVFAFS